MQQHRFTVEGTTTRINLVALAQGNFVAAPDVYMSSVQGLYFLAQRIPGRGIKSPLRADERLIEIDSSHLEVFDSDMTAHYMTIEIMNNLLYGIADAIHSGVWFREAAIDIWNGDPRQHVGHGYLTNRYTPGRTVNSAATESSAATA